MSSTDMILDLFGNNYQHIVAVPVLISDTKDSPLHCHSIWDAREARFTACFLPFISALPALVAIVVLISVLLRWTWKKPPKWARPLVKEPIEPADCNLKSSTRPYFAAFLFIISSLGASLHFTSVFHPTLHLQALFPTGAWAVAITLIATRRPRNAPISLLFIYISLVISQLIALLHMHMPSTQKDIIAIISLFLAAVAIVTIINMPLRDPRLSQTNDISGYLTSPTHVQRSPEDNLTTFQWYTASWLSPLLFIGGKRQLDEDDVWNLAYQFQHRLLHHAFRDLKGSVLRRILVANFKDVFLILPFLSLLNLFLTFASPLLLQQLLRSLANPISHPQAAVTYAVLSLLVRLVQAQIGVINTWYSRRAYERSRGEMIMMVTEKTLKRKTVATPEKLEDGSNSASPLVVNGTSGPLDDGVPEAPADGQLKGSESANITPSSAYARAQQLWTNAVKFRAFLGRDGSKKPPEVKTAASTGKLLSIIRSDIYEVSQRFWEVDTILSIPLGFIFSVIVISRLVGWRSCAIGISEILVFQAMNAGVTRLLLIWERKRRIATDIRLSKISEFITALRHLRYYGWEAKWLQAILDSRETELEIRLYTGLLRNVLGALSMLAGQLLPVAIFAGYTLLGGQLSVDIAFPALTLFAFLQDSLRDLPNLITTFLNANVALHRIQDFMDEDEISLDNDHRTGGRLALYEASFSWPGLSHIVLHKVTLDFPVGLTVVFGEVGSGKTSLLLALLGEMELKSGDLVRSQTSLSFAAQSPWLQSQSLRENILFGNVWDDNRYNQVVDACELYKDFADMKFGDKTLIGEGGIGLSGGQKARVAFARAVYHQSEYVLLDDPLAPLDWQTGEQIVRKLLHGPLMKNRRTILVTHRTDYFTLDTVSQMVQVSKGEVQIMDKESAIPSIGFSQLSSARTTTGDDDVKQQENADSEQEKFVEKRAHGSVKASIYWEYVKAGRFYLWFGFIAILAADRVVSVLKTWFLKEFGEAYNGSFQELALRLHDLLPGVNPGMNPRPWLLLLLYISLTQSVFYIIANIMVLFIVRAGGRSMFGTAMRNFSYATFRFLETTPSGVLLNRMTGDMAAVDGGNVTRLLQNVIFQLFTWISALAIFFTTSLYFLIVAVVVVLAFLLIFRRFLPTSQSLRRLEMTSLTPLLSNFGVMLDGLMTIRAFSQEHEFLDRVIAVTDCFQRMDHFYWSVQSWLSLRLDAVSASATFILTLIAIYSKFSAGLLAFVLTAASRFVTTTHALVKQTAQMNMEFVSIERVVEIMHVDKEPQGHLKPPAAWPLPTGDIVFEDVTIRYAKNLDPSLSNLNFTIKGGSSVAIIGRTGSGKSTLALSLLATILPSPDEGRILIDNIDISQVEKQTLRQRVTFLAQDPVLFPGTMHQNLDPLSEYTPEDCTSVLSLVGGSYGWTLTTKVEAGGNNLSQGQRQIIGLARAILRRSSIVILDEATASIDMGTAKRIQELLRESLKGSTLITIAHRLEAVVGAQYCIVLENGRVVRQGSAEDVLGSGGGSGSGNATPAGVSTPRRND